MYFAINTLSGSGYGDIQPQNNMETVHEILVVLVACAFLAMNSGFFSLKFEDDDAKADQHQHDTETLQ